MHCTLDHIVLNVTDMERMLRFYTGVMEFPAERLDAYRAGSVPFPSVRLNAHTIIDLFDDSEAAEQGRNTNLNHFCIAVSEPDFNALRQRLARHGVTPHGEPGTRWGARGDATAFSFPDPEGNVIEIRYYPAPSATAG